MTETRRTLRQPPKMATGTDGAVAREPSRRRKSVRLTPYRLRRICEKIEQGVPQSAAALSIGIPRRTFDNWLAAGREQNAEGIYRELAEAVDEARAKFHMKAAAVVVGHAEKDPRSAQFVLERRFPDDWGQPRDGVTVNVGVIVESPEWLALRDRMLVALAPFPEALEAVAALLGGQEHSDVVDGEVVEVKEIEP